MYSRLIVRRVKRLNRPGEEAPGTLFDTYRYHAVFVTGRYELLQAESHHRGHAIVEQVFADASASALAHLPSGSFNANVAWTLLWVIAHNLTRAAWPSTCPPRHPRPDRRHPVEKPDRPAAIPCPPSEFDPRRSNSSSEMINRIRSVDPGSGRAFPRLPRTAGRAHGQQPRLDVADVGDGCGSSGVTTRSVPHLARALAHDADAGGGSVVGGLIGGWWWLPGQPPIKPPMIGAERSLQREAHPSAIGFLRDVGKHFRVNRMLAGEAVSARLNSEAGISFTEFGYQILQGMDFPELHRRYGCTRQTGRSDQWGNLTAGTDLIHRVTGLQLLSG